VKTIVALTALVAALAAGNATASPGVRVRISNEMTSFYTEGYVWFASLDKARPKRVVTPTVVLPAGPGRHVLRVFIRPCDGTCSLLDPPQLRCSARVRRGQTATYHLRDRGCSITVHG
jgi:hypothetical protein